MATSPRRSRVALAAKHVFILKNAASGVTGWLMPLTVGTVLRRLVSILVLHKALPFAAEYLLAYQVSTVAAAGTDILVLSFREKLQQFVHDPDKVALRADAANAFKSMPRADILESLRACSPGSAIFSHHI
jgi:hypothetical protein